jgi:hypothetical protein
MIEGLGLGQSSSFGEDADVFAQSSLLVQYVAAELRNL